MSFKDISYLELWQPFGSVRNHLSNFGGRHYEEHFCDLFFEFGPVIPEM